MLNFYYNLLILNSLYMCLNSFASSISFNIIFIVISFNECGEIIIAQCFPSDAFRYRLLKQSESWP